MVMILRMLKHHRHLMCVVGAMVVVMICTVARTRPDVGMQLGGYTGEEGLMGTLQSKLVLGDVRLMRCLSESCEPPEHYVKVRPALNWFDDQFHVFSYFLIYRKVGLDYGQQFLVDLRFQYDSPGLGFELTNRYGVRMWSKRRTTEDIGQDEAPLRDLQVLFGEEDLMDKRLGWELQENPVMDFSSIYRVHLSLLKVRFQEEESLIEELERFQQLKKEEIILGNKERFRVLQISDLHFGQSKGRCTDKTCGFDLKTAEFVRESIQKEDVDFVVISGDLIDFNRSPHIQSVLLKALSPIMEANIPFVFTFGESDTNEFDNPHFRTDKLKILGFLSSLHKCYNTVPSPSFHIHGFTNHELSVFINRGGVTTKKGIVTVLDSEDHKIDASQINYLYRSHPTVKENVFRLLFFHYPIPNFRPTGIFSIVGSYNEKHQLNSKTDSTYRDDIVKCGYNVVAVGHEHQNDGCILSKSDTEEQGFIWLCYGGVTGDSAETRLIENYERMSRVYEMKFPSSQLITWKIKESDRNGFDYQSIANL